MTKLYYILFLFIGMYIGALAVDIFYKQKELKEKRKYLDNIVVGYNKTDIMNAYCTGYMQSCLVVAENSDFNDDFTIDVFITHMTSDSVKYSKLIDN